VQPYLFQLAYDFLHGVATMRLRGRLLTFFSRTKSASVDDMVSEVQIAILYSLHRYNPKHSFSTWMTPVAIGGMWKVANAQYGAVMHVSEKIINDALRSARATDDSMPRALLQKGWNPELVQGVNVSQTHDYVPIDEHLQVPSLPDVYAELEDRLVVETLFTELPPKELDIIKSRYGFYGKEETLKHVGERYDVCKERIRQIERKALETMRVAYYSRDPEAKLQA